jgi:hypothetical protein
MWRMAEAGYKRHYRVVHENMVGLYLSAILKCTLLRDQMLTFVFQRAEAEDPSIRSVPASTGSCALQSAMLCMETKN